jgi:hypothetical protein
VAEPINLALGLDIFRKVLENEGQHTEDAVKTAIGVVVEEDRLQRTTVINREQWRAYSLSGDSVECKTTVRSGGVDIEDSEGKVEIIVITREDGVDVRVGDLQLVIKDRALALLQKHPPYPIKEWTVLFEGELVSRG